MIPLIVLMLLDYSFTGRELNGTICCYHCCLFSVNVMQVWNSSSYCSNDLIYTCINENSPIIIWNVYDGIRSIAHFAVNRNETGRSDLRSVVVSYTVTHINSTSLTSTLVLTSTQSADAPYQHNYNIYCNNILAVNTPRSFVSCKL